MRRREVKAGMFVEHAASGKKLGIVDRIGPTLIHGRYPTTGERWIAIPAELRPVSNPKDSDASGRTGRGAT